MLFVVMLCMTIGLVETGHGQLGPQLTHGCKRGPTVHARHCDIERHDVGHERSYLLERLDAVSGCPYDAKIMAELDNLSDESAHECAVIDHQYSLCRLWHCSVLLGQSVRLGSPVNPLPWFDRRE